MKTALIVLAVAGIGGAAYLFWRGRSQQTIQLATAQAATVGATPASGGGVSGLAGRLFGQWKSDPLGVQNTKALVGGVVGVGKSAVTSVGSAVSSVGHEIASWF